MRAFRRCSRSGFRNFRLRTCAPARVSTPNMSSPSGFGPSNAITLESQPLWLVVGLGSCRSFRSFGHAGASEVLSLGFHPVSATIARAPARASTQNMGFSSSFSPSAALTLEVSATFAGRGPRGLRKLRACGRFGSALARVSATFGSPFRNYNSKSHSGVSELSSLPFH